MTKIVSSYGIIPGGSFHHVTMGCDVCVRFDTCENEFKGRCVRCSHSRMIQEEE